MLIKYFYDERLAQASYLIGCPGAGQALVIDPSRDIQQYLEVAQTHGMNITHVAETHIHADFVSGARELAAATGATLYLSDAGTPDWKYAYAKAWNAVLLKDGDNFMVGNVKIDVIATPGHTPEHLCFIYTDTASANQPMGIATGDFIFVGDVGRPDLLEEAAGFVGTKEVGARQQFKSIQKIKQMPDYLQILPGHGAGSACGKALGAIPTTTLGYEKRFNPAFQFEDENQFVAWLLEGQPEPPRYFAQMKQVNKLGIALIKDLPVPQRGTRAQLDELLANGAVAADFRSREAFRAAHVPNTLSIPSVENNFNTYVGWFADYTAPFAFIVERESDVAEMLVALRAIGIDNVPYFFTPEVISSGHNVQLAAITAAEAAALSAAGSVQLLDVRGASEYAEIHAVGALHIPVGFLPRHLANLAKTRPLVTYCAGGYRSQIAASLLKKHGFEVMTLSEGDSVWRKVLPTERGIPQPVNA
ncbi:MAG: MBL fold metallo-hydrolase [Anaerolineae bacterium]